ncbi:MAG: TonB-dependent receptor [Alphaproteobacteria bacterium]|nr:TonB-dependent receptor [Alphaproteobacteria bacterium]
MNKFLTLTAIGTVMLAAGNAQAAGFLLREQSVAGMGNAFAGATAGAEDPSYSFYNPAGLTMHYGTKLSANATAIVGNVEGYDAVGPNGAYTSEMSHPVDKAVLPSVAVSHQINNRLSAGLSLNAPFGLITDYSQNWAGANHGTESKLNTYDLTPMLAYRATCNLSFGAGLVVQYVSATLKNGALYHIHPAYYTNAKLKGDTTDIGYTIGALYELTDNTRFGISYRSQINHKLKGDITFAKQTGALGLVNQDISAKLTTPALLSMGAYHDINDKWSVMAEIQKTYWSSFDDLTIKGNKKAVISQTNESWKDVWFYSIGASYRVNDQWKLRAGLAFDQTPVNDYTRTPRIPDSDRIWYSGGVEYKFDDSLTLNAGYTYIRAEHSKVNLQATGWDASRGALSAKYKGNIHLFGLSANYNF